MQKQASLTYIDVEEAPRQRKQRFRKLQPAIRRYIPLLLVLAAAYRFIGLSFGEMQQWDEAIYALRTDAVLKFGALWDQSPFMLRGSYYAAHPPLYVWLSTAWRLLLGDGVWVYRLTSALAGALAVFLVYGIARRVTTRAFAFAAAVWFAAAPLPVFMSRQGQLDMLLTCTMLAALLFMMRYLKDGRRGQWAAAVFLGLALMTKMFYAFSLPAAALAAALLFAGEGRRRALRLGILLPVFSAPLWLPWLISFVVQHGGGDPLFFLSSDSPLGASIAGQEGSAKDTGLLYYFNQLVVQLGLLFPLYLAGLYHAIRRNTSRQAVLLAVFTLVQFAELLALRSAFEVYLIPLLAPAAVLAVRMVPRIRYWDIGKRLGIGLSMAVCLAWSLSAPLRAGVKDVLLHLPSPSAIVPGAAGDASLLLLVLLAASGTVLLLWKSGRLRTLYTAGFMHLFVFALWTATAVRIWTGDPGRYTDGAREITSLALATGADTLVLVGNGDNPQLTWYLHGADIGWPGDSSRVFERMEPRDIGVKSIMRRLAATRPRNVAVILEKDEIAAGVYRHASDVLPPTYHVVSDARRYLLARPGEAAHGR